MKYRKPIREKNYLYIPNKNNIVNKYLFQCEIKHNQKKPQESNKIPKDININDIFNNMLNITKEIYRNANNSLFYKLSPDEINKRKIILDSIKCFILQNKIRYKLFYNIIFLFDLLSIKNQKNKLLNEIEKIGLGSTILTLKFNYEENRMITNKKYKIIFKNKYFSSKEIKEIEILCLKLIKYNLNIPSPISFMEIMLLNRIISYQDDIKKDSKKRIYNLIMNTMEKILCESNEYIKYNPLYLCCCIIYYTREILGIEKWPRILSNLFNTNFQSFENIYNEYFKIYKNKDNNRSNNYDSSNNISTNIDSQRNLSNSKRNDKSDDINNKKNKISLYNNLNNYYKANNYKNGIRKINLNISQGIITEKKRIRYNRSVEAKEDKRIKEIYSYQKDLPKDKSMLYKNKSNLDNLFKRLNSPLDQKNDDKLLSSKNNIINSNGYRNNNIKTIDITNNLDKRKESIRNINICFIPFKRNINYKDTNKNLDKFINTDSNNNNNNNNQLFTKKYNGFYENKNNRIYQKEILPKNSNNYINGFNNSINYNYNKIRRHSSCEINNEKMNRYINNNEYETSMEKIKRKNYFYSKNIGKRIIDKENGDNEEDNTKNSFFYNLDNHRIKTRNENRNYANYGNTRSIDMIPKNNTNLCSIRKYNPINNIIFERKKNAEQNETLRNPNKSINKENYRYNSLEIYSQCNKNSSEINNNNHTRNFYKQKNIGIYKLISKN